MKKAFIAYAGEVAAVGQTIEAAAEHARLHVPDLQVDTWKRDDLGGSQLIEPIIRAIENSDVVVADITTLNFNVTYELGYAIGLGKRVLPVRSRAYVADDIAIQRIGIFDTLIREEYTSSTDLVGLISGAATERRFATVFPFDAQPLYTVLPEIQTDDIIHLLARAKKTGLRARRFDPTENPRLSATEAIRAVCASYGVVLPLLAPNVVDSKIHNIRIAFVAGLAHALQKVTMLVQQGVWPTPLDVRDSVEAYENNQRITALFEEFAERVNDARWSSPVPTAGAENKLAALNLGDPTAENEETQLEGYFLERDEFRQVLTGHANIVIGRKGSGKTAVFVRVRDVLRTNRANVVTDLNPETYQLRKLKDLIIESLSAGSKEHLLAAFWEYVLLLEVCAKILEKDRDVHKRNHDLFEPYQRLVKFYKSETATAGSEFSERLMILIAKLAERYKKEFGEKGQAVLGEASITNILYETNLPELRAEIEKYARHKDGIFILFDNLDKAWNANGLEDSDIVMIRTLLEASRRLEHAFDRSGTKFHCVVFLRNDIYELLVKSTADRGKQTPVVVDWNRADLLRQMIRQRLLYNHTGKEVPIEALWYPICTPVIDGEDSLNYLIDRCLMRPRYLLRLINYCKGHAINFGRNRIDDDDIVEGLSSFSTDIVTEIDLEIRDVLPIAADTLYSFIGENRRLRKSEVLALIAKKLKDPEGRAAVFALLLFHGVLGLHRDDNETSFIYDVNYDLKRLIAALERADGGDPFLLINPAFWPGLEIT